MVDLSKCMRLGVSKVIRDKFVISLRRVSKIQQHRLDGRLKLTLDPWKTSLTERRLRLKPIFGWNQRKHTTTPRSNNRFASCESAYLLVGDSWFVSDLYFMMWTLVRSQSFLGTYLGSPKMRSSIFDTVCFWFDYIAWPNLSRFPLPYMPEPTSVHICWRGDGNCFGFPCSPHWGARGD